MYGNKTKQITVLMAPHTPSASLLPSSCEDLAPNMACLSLSQMPIYKLLM